MYHLIYFFPLPFPLPMQKTRFLFLLSRCLFTFSLSFFLYAYWRAGNEPNQTKSTQSSSSVWFGTNSNWFDNAAQYTDFSPYTRIVMILLRPQTDLKLLLAPCTETYISDSNRFLIYNVGLMISKNRDLSLPYICCL